MATGKKKIIVYADWKASFDALTDEEAGKLIKHFFAYVNDENPVCEDRIVSLMFEPIKATLKRDLESWLKTQDKNRLNGSRGGRPKKQTEPKKPNGLNLNPKNPNKGDSDSVSVNDKDIYRRFAHLSMSISEFESLEVDYHKQQIDYVLDSIENFSGNKKYKSLYLTAKNWLKKEPKKSEAPIQQKSVEQLTYESVMKQMEANR